MNIDDKRRQKHKQQQQKIRRKKNGSAVKRRAVRKNSAKRRVVSPENRLVAKTGQPIDIVDRASFTQILVIALAGGIILVSAIILYVSQQFPIGNHYYVRNGAVEKLENGEYFNLEIRDEPIITEASILRWAELRALEMHNMRSLNYTDKLEALRPYFTKAAYDDFITAFNTSDFTEELRSNEGGTGVIATAVAREPAVIVNTSIMNGSRAWQVQVRLSVSRNFVYQNTTVSTDRNVTMIIRRVDTRVNPTGYAIVEVRVSSGGGMGGG